MYTSGGLGQAQVLALAVPEIESLLSNITTLFTGSSADATHQAILQWVGIIAANPAEAMLAPTTGASTASPANALLWLRCWAGDQTVVPQYRLASGDPATNGCGCETAHGCRVDAQSALAQVVKAIPGLTIGPLSAVSVPSGAGGGSVYSTGGVLVPLPGSTLTGGIPTNLLLGIGALAVVALVAKRGR